MGVADSPLRDRVIFVQGAPRSGTTWLVLLLATHKDIAGIQTESHLFEFGVNTLFDSHEGNHPGVRLPLIRPYLKREQLVDLMRDLCDGVFLAMRTRISRGTDPPFIVEKTPTSVDLGGLDLRRKRECYPDAWYLHIVRDGDAVTRSLMRSSFIEDRSEENCNRVWREAVEVTRDALSDHPRYREVSYEELRSDPAEVARGLFEWLGVDAGEQTLDTVRALSRERFSEQPAVGPSAVKAPGLTQRARQAASTARGVAGRARRRLAPRPPEPVAQSPVAFNFVTALRQGDGDKLRAMTTDSVVFSHRTSAGDLVVTGDEAREAMIRLGGQLFDGRYVNARWSSAEGGPRQWWTSAPGLQFWTVFFSGLAGDATRVDIGLSLTLERDLIAQVTSVSAGPLAGRPSSELSSQSEPALFPDGGEPISEA